MGGEGAASGAGGGGGEATTGTTSTVSSSTGETPHPHGESPATHAFYMSRAVVAPPSAQAALKDSYESLALDLDLDFIIETRREWFVPNWTVKVYETTWANHAGFTFIPETNFLNPDDSAQASATFNATAADVLSTYPEQPWDAEWNKFAADFLAAEATVPFPDSWKGTRDEMLIGALRCAKIGAIRIGAKTFDEVLASFASVASSLYLEEEKAFAALVAMK